MVLCSITGGTIIKEKFSSKMELHINYSLIISEPLNNYYKISFLFENLYFLRKINNFRNNDSKFYFMSKNKEKNL